VKTCSRHSKMVRLRIALADQSALHGSTHLSALLSLLYVPGVSKYPAMEGRFPCVDGVRFSFDPNKPEGARVVEGSVTVAEKDSNELQPLDLSKKYTVASKTYLLNGKDGYESFAGAPIVLDDESCTSKKCAC